MLAQKQYMSINKNDEKSLSPRILLPYFPIPFSQELLKSTAGVFDVLYFVIDIVFALFFYFFLQ